MVDNGKTAQEEQLSSKAVGGADGEIWMIRDCFVARLLAMTLFITFNVQRNPKGSDRCRKL